MITVIRLICTPSTDQCPAFLYRLYQKLFGCIITAYVVVFDIVTLKKTAGRRNGAKKKKKKRKKNTINKSYLSRNGSYRGHHQLTTFSKSIINATFSSDTNLILFFGRIFPSSHLSPIPPLPPPYEHFLIVTIKLIFEGIIFFSYLLSFV